LAHRLLNDTIIALFRLVRIARQRPIGATPLPLLACGLAAAATSACLFTNPINTPPTVQVTSLTPIARGQPAQFQAVVTDDQSEPPTVDWGRADGTCPPSSEWSNPARWPPRLVPADIFTVDGPMTLAPFCVWAVARDRYGARGAYAYTAIPTNHPPVAVLKVVSPIEAPPYNFLSQFRLSAVESTDAESDPLTFTWMVSRKPPGSQVPDQPLPCADDPTNVRVRCLASDLSGSYQVDVTVRDLTDGATASVPLTVLEDKMPCIDIHRIAPDVAMAVHALSGDLAVTEEEFSVPYVNDDLDPLPSPTSMLHFRWSTARNSDPLVVQETDISTFRVPTNSFHILDTLRVRVEIRDRNNGPEIDGALGACFEDRCTASTQRAYQGVADCYLRYTWTVQYE
jgi:hypothetical protein